MRVRNWWNCVTSVPSRFLYSVNWSQWFPSERRPFVPFPDVEDLRGRISSSSWKGSRSSTSGRRDSSQLLVHGPWPSPGLRCLSSPLLPGSCPLAARAGWSWLPMRACSLLQFGTLYSTLCAWLAKGQTGKVGVNTSLDKAGHALLVGAWS